MFPTKKNTKKSPKWVDRQLDRLLEGWIIPASQGGSNHSIITHHHTTKTTKSKRFFFVFFASRSVANFQQKKMKDQVWTEMCVVLFVFIFFEVENHKLKAFATKKMLCAKRHLLYSKMQYVFQPTNNFFVAGILAVKFCTAWCSEYNLSPPDAETIKSGWKPLAALQGIQGFKGANREGYKDLQKLTDLKSFSHFGRVFGLSNVLSVWTPFPTVEAKDFLGGPILSQILARYDWRMALKTRKVWEKCFASLYAG